MINPWFLQTEDYGGGDHSCVTPGFLRASMVQNFGDTSARSIVLSVSPCRVPGCVGLAVDKGVKRTSLSAASSTHPCWLVTWSHILDLCLPVRLPSPQGNPNFPL